MNKIYLASFFFAVLGLAIGVIIGYFSRRLQPKTTTNAATYDAYAMDKSISNKIITQMDPKQLSENLRFLTARPHLAASERDKELIEEIYNRWKSYNFDEVLKVPYTIMLSRPNPQNPNKVYIVSNSEDILYTSSHREEPIHPEDNITEFVDAFHSYSPNGTVTGDVVYVNYGTTEDFDQLQAMGISAEGKIVLVKYGKIFRGNKVMNAENHKAIGVIIFSDPSEVAREGTDPSKVYPYSFWLPDTGIQRGSVFLAEGDPLTPGFPSVEDAYRIPMDEVKVPKIPSQPIGYKDAYEILRRVGGREAPNEWQGGLNLTYNIGPGFSDTTTKVKLSVHNEYLMSELDHNVIGIIKGAVEPDRFVLTGNHRDAWGFGAVDPSSGTAQLLEITRVYGELLKEGWRPRRTVVFCSWAAEEYSLIGSVEWVEENIHKFVDRAVTYINVDVCTSGPKLSMSATPLMQEAIFEVLKQIPDPQEPAKNLFTTWSEYTKAVTKSNEATLPTLGSGSDMAPFMFYAGIASVDLGFQADMLKYNISMYPAYHTGYETYYMVENFIDPGFKNHQGCSRIAGLLLRYFADALLLPLNVRDLSAKILTSLTQLKTKSGGTLTAQGISLDKLEKAIEEFQNTANDWHERLNKIDKNNVLEVRMVNDQIMRIERIFLVPEDLPGREKSFYKHAIFAPSKYNVYSTSGFPALIDLLYEAQKDSTNPKRWELIKKHLSDIIIMIRQASKYLQELHKI